MSEVVPGFALGCALVKLATFLPAGSDAPRAGEVRGDEVVAFPPGTSVRDLLATDADATADDEPFPLDRVTLLAPVPDPGVVYAIGLNYAAHAAETGGEPPERPIVFVKARNSVAPPGGPVRCPAVVRSLTWSRAGSQLSFKLAGRAVQTTAARESANGPSAHSATARIAGKLSACCGEYRETP